MNASAVCHLSKLIIKRNKKIRVEIGSSLNNYDC
jgi:hypothetical protein